MIGAIFQLTPHEQLTFTPLATQRTRERKKPKPQSKYRSIPNTNANTTMGCLKVLGCTGVLAALGVGGTLLFMRAFALFFFQSNSQRLVARLPQKRILRLQIRTMVRNRQTKHRHHQPHCRKHLRWMLQRSHFQLCPASERGIIPHGTQCHVIVR